MSDPPKSRRGFPIVRRGAFGYMPGITVPCGDDPRRCEWGKSKQRQCKAWKWKQHARYCRFHARYGKGSRASDVVRNGRCNMPRFYSHVLSGTLNDAINAHLAYSPDEQFALVEELSITREFAARALELWQQLGSTRPIEIPADADDKTKLSLQLAEAARRASVEAAVGAAENALDRVKAYAESAARIFAGVKDKCNIHTMQTIVNQLVRLMYEVTKDQGDEGLRIAERFEGLVKVRVKLPELANTQGTTITPDQIVTSMDATIPGFDADPLTPG